MTVMTVKTEMNRRQGIPPVAVVVVVEVAMASYLVASTVDLVVVVLAWGEMQQTSSQRQLSIQQ